MKLFSQCIEEGTTLYGRLDPKQAKSIQGRSNVNIKSTKDKPPAVYNTTTQEMEAPLIAEAARHLAQHRRLITMRNCSHKLNNKNNNNNNNNKKKNPTETST